MNDTSFSQSSIEKNSSNSQPSSTKRKQPPKVISQNSYFYFLLFLGEIPYSFGLFVFFFKKKRLLEYFHQASASVSILLVCQNRKIDLKPLAFFPKKFHLRCSAGIEELFLRYEILQLTN